MTIAAGNIGCPFCRAQLDYEGTVCGDCGASVVARGPLAHRTEVRVTGRRVRLAVTRRSWDGEELLVWRDGPRGLRFRRPKGRRRPAADDEGLTFEPIEVGPDTCAGCDDQAVFVVDGEASVYQLEGCDDDWCYYENPSGIA